MRLYKRFRIDWTPYVFFFFSSRRRHTRCSRDWSSDVCSSDLHGTQKGAEALFEKGNCLAEIGNDDAAVKAYTAALPHHDSPDAVQFSLERAERRLQRGSPVNPRNTAAVWDRGDAQRRASAQQAGPYS